MNKINTISIDLAKNVFQLMAFDKNGFRLQSKHLGRDTLKTTILNLPPCTTVMEACATSHYWGRTFEAMGHKVLLIPAQHVTPFVRGNKNDKNDCLAIFEASQRPNIRFVPIKSEQQQAILVLHSYRERLMSAQTACITQTRSLLLEFGLVIPKSVAGFNTHLPILKDQALHPILLSLLADVEQQMRALDEKLKQIKQQLQSLNNQNAAAKIMCSIPGIGSINASAYSAAIDKGQAFKNGQELGGWLGLTPRQYASGNTNRLGSITKRGNRYLRKQLVHGARAIVNHAHKKDDDLNRWITELVKRRGRNKAVVATAHRLARLMWVLLQKNECYVPQYRQQGATQSC